MESFLAAESAGAVLWARYMLLVEVLLVMSIVRTTYERVLYSSNAAVAHRSPDLLASQSDRTPSTRPAELAGYRSAT
eukprot:scaffold317098_cov15-Prasinocladus_malaysianus.AAC.1